MLILGNSSTVPSVAHALYSKKKVANKDPIAPIASSCSLETRLQES